MKENFVKIRQCYKRKISHLYLLAFLFIISNSWAGAIYVDGKLSSDCPNRNYSIANRDCSGYDGNAYRTIQAAVNVAKAGDIVYIRENIYFEKVLIARNGTINNPIIFQNYPDEKPVIDGNNKTLPSGNGLISLNDKDYIKIIGLTISNSKYYGIQAWGGCDNITIQKCEVLYSNHGGIIFESSSNIIVDSCEVHHNNDLGLSAWQEAITMTGVNSFEVKNCKVHHNKEEGIDAKYGAINGSIHHNEAYSNNGPNIYVDGANHIEIYNNKVYNTMGQKSGIMLAVEEHANRYITTNCNIYNNLIYDNNSGICFWIESGAYNYGYISDCYIMNNTIHSNEVNGGIWIMNVGSKNYINIMVRNNIFLDNDSSGKDEIRDSSGSNQLSHFTIDHNFFKAGAHSDIYGSHYLMSEDVKLVDIFNHDYRLQSDSPAREGGNSEKAPAFDYENNRRPYGNGYDIGAYEFSTPPPPQNLKGEIIYR